MTRKKAPSIGDFVRDNVYVPVLVQGELEYVRYATRSCKHDVRQPYTSCKGSIRLYTWL